MAKQISPRSRMGLPNTDGGALRSFTLPSQGDFGGSILPAQTDAAYSVRHATGMSRARWYSNEAKPRVCYTYRMLKRSLIETNPYLQDTTKRRDMFWMAVHSSTGIEGVRLELAEFDERSSLAAASMSRRGFVRSARSRP